MYEYNIKVLRVIDGDTVDVMADLGFHVWIYNRLRLLGIDAPETRTRDLEEKARGFVAKEELERILMEAIDREARIYIRSHDVDKYGRSLATIFVEREDGTFWDVNEYLLINGFVGPYLG